MRPGKLLAAAAVSVAMALAVGSGSTSVQGEEGPPTSPDGDSLSTLVLFLVPPGDEEDSEAGVDGGCELANLLGSLDLQPTVSRFFDLAPTPLTNPTCGMLSSLLGGLLGMDTGDSTATLEACETEASASEDDAASDDDDATSEDDEATEDDDDEASEDEEAVDDEASDDDDGAASEEEDVVEDDEEACEADETVLADDETPCAEDGGSLVSDEAIDARNLRSFEDVFGEVDEACDDVEDVDESEDGDVSEGEEDEASVDDEEASADEEEQNTSDEEVAQDEASEDKSDATESEAPSPLSGLNTFLIPMGGTEAIEGGCTLAELIEASGVSVPIVRADVFGSIEGVPEIPALELPPDLCAILTALFATISSDDESPPTDASEDSTDDGEEQVAEEDNEDQQEEEEPDEEDSLFQRILDSLSQSGD